MRIFACLRCAAALLTGLALSPALAAPDARPADAKSEKADAKPSKPPLEILARSLPVDVDRGIAIRQANAWFNDAPAR